MAFNGTFINWLQFNSKTRSATIPAMLQYRVYGRESQMPLQNRVTPFDGMTALPAGGLFTSNRVALPLCLAFALAAAPLCQVHAGENPLVAGRYDVEVRLELPHVEDLNMKKTTAICVLPDSRDGTSGLAVLGDNNPLSRCPASNVRRSGSVLTFDIICEGTNAARASASYVLAGEAFRGRIVMKMGGKNMTMSETQAGRRVGACPEPPP